MNDRFKFRFWNTEYNCYADTDFIPEYVVSDGDIVDLGLEIINGAIPEQCTGLKDNCGNLIYEGDIIGDGEDDYVIKWDSNRTMFVAEDSDTSYEIEDVLDPTICVIGNIHKQAEQKD